MVRGYHTLLQARNCVAAGNDGSEDVTLHSNTKRERNDIEEEKVLGISRGSLAGEDTGLDSGTVSNGLIGVDALLELLSVEKIAEKLLNLGNTGGATNEDDLVDLALVNVGILQHLFNRLDGSVEGLGVQVLETSTGNVGVEIFSIEEGVDLNGGLGSVGQRSLGTLASSAETTECTGVTRQILLGLLLELLSEVIQKSCIKVASA